MTKGLTTNTATKQAAMDHDERGRFTFGNIPKTGFHTNPERRKNGPWKRENTARYKLEMMMQLTDEELLKLKDLKDTPLFEKQLVDAFLNGSWPVVRDMMNQVYGYPKTYIEEDKTVKDEIFIKGFVLPSYDDKSV